MDGIFVNGSRPKSKKAIKEAVANGDRVVIEVTAFGSERNIPLSDILDIGGYYSTTFVGPDPYTKRSFYGTLTVRDGKVTVK